MLRTMPTSKLHFPSLSISVEAIFSELIKKIFFFNWEKNPLLIWKEMTINICFGYLFLFEISGGYLVLLNPSFNSNEKKGITNLQDSHVKEHKKIYPFQINVVKWISEDCMCFIMF